MDGLLGSEFALVLRDSLNSTPRRYVTRSPPPPAMPSPPKKPRSSSAPEFAMPCDMKLEPRMGFAPIPTSPTSPLPIHRATESPVVASADSQLPSPGSLGILRPRSPITKSKDSGVRRQLSSSLAAAGAASLDVLAIVSAEQRLRGSAELPNSPIRSDAVTLAPEDKKKKHRASGKAAGNGRVFSCTQCTSTFSQQFNLNKHVRAVHERRRPFECKTCHAKFQQKSHRTMHHLAVHEKLRQFACDQCNMSFSWRGVLKKHRKSIHGMDD